MSTSKSDFFVCVLRASSREAALPVLLAMGTKLGLDTASVVIAKHGRGTNRICEVGLELATGSDWNTIIAAVRGSLRSLRRSISQGRKMGADYTVHVGAWPSRRGFRSPALLHAGDLDLLANGGVELRFTLYPRRRTLVRSPAPAASTRRAG